MNSPRKIAGIISREMRHRRRNPAPYDDSQKEINPAPPQPLGDLVRCLICKEKFYGKAYLNCHIRNEHVDEMVTSTEPKETCNQPPPPVADTSNPSNLGTAWAPPTTHSSGLVRINTNIIRRAPRKIKPCFSVSACKRRHDVHHSVPSLTQKPSAIPKNEQQPKKPRLVKVDTLEKSSVPSRTEQESKRIVSHKSFTTTNVNSFRPEIPQVPLHTCFICARQFSTSTTLLSHVRDDHQYDRGPFQCKKCTFGCDDASAFVVHRFRKCKPFTTFSCSFCPRDFSSLYCKDIHENRHSNAANEAHECPECGAVYFRTCLMAKHLLMDHK